MTKKLAASTVLSTAGVILFLLTITIVTNGGTYINESTAMISIIFPFVAYMIIYFKAREHFWKSFFIGIIIGFPIGIMLSFYNATWYQTTPEYNDFLNSQKQLIQTGERSLYISHENVNCIRADNYIMIPVSNPSNTTIYSDEINVNFIEGSCENVDFSADYFSPNLFDIEYIDLTGCTDGTIIVDVISPEGTDKVIVDC